MPLNINNTTAARKKRAANRGRPSAGARAKVRQEKADAEAAVAERKAVEREYI